MLNQLIDLLGNLSETTLTILVSSVVLLIVIGCTVGVMIALKKGVKPQIIALPFGIVLLVIMVLVIKIMHDRNDGGPLYYIFFSLVPFLGYARAISQLEDIKRRMEEAKEYKRTGKRPQQTKLEKSFAIIALVVMAIGLILTFLVSKKAGLAFVWLSAFCSTALIIIRPRMFIKLNEDSDEDARNRVIKSVRLGGVFSSCFILFVAYLTLSN